MGRKTSIIGEIRNSLTQIERFLSQFEIFVFFDNPILCEVRDCLGSVLWNNVHKWIASFIWHLSSTVGKSIKFFNFLFGDYYYGH